MFKNYLKIAAKNLLNNKVNTFINITGLAIGLASCVIVLLYVAQELSYDRYHEEVDQLYRVAIVKDVDGLNRGQASVPFRTAEVLQQDYPEIVQSARLAQLFQQDPVIKVGDEQFNEKYFYFAEASLFEVLTIPFVKGDPGTALNQPNSIVLTASTVEKYFGTTEVLGRTLTINLSQTNTDYKITGVLHDYPNNTHFKYDLLASFDNYWAVTNPFFRERLKSWFMLPFWTYVKLAPETDANELEAKMMQVITKYFPPTRQDSRLFLQPVPDIHLNSSIDNEFEPNSDIRYIYIFSAIALLVLVIACINFMNLSTAKSMHRAKEVGLRKMLGAERPQLIKQFLFESLLTTTIAVLLALCVVELAMNRVNAFTNIAPQDNYFNLQFILIMLGLTFIVSFAAGIYPAFFLSSFQPMKTLKGVFARSSQGRGLRKGLAIAQMVIAVILLVSIVTI